MEFRSTFYKKVGLSWSTYSKVQKLSVLSFSKKKTSPGDKIVVFHTESS